MEDEPSLTVKDSRENNDADAEVNNREIGVKSAVLTSETILPCKKLGVEMAMDTMESPSPSLPTDCPGVFDPENDASTSSADASPRSSLTGDGVPFGVNDIGELRDLLPSLLEDDWSLHVEAKKRIVHLVLAKVSDHDKSSRHQCTLSFSQFPSSSRTSAWNFLLRISPKISVKMSATTRAFRRSSNTVVDFATSKASFADITFPLCLRNPVDLLEMLRHIHKLEVVPLHLLQAPGELPLEEVELYTKDDEDDDTSLPELNNNNEDGNSFPALSSFAELKGQIGEEISDMDTLLSALDHGILPRGWSATMLSHGPLMGLCFTHVVLDFDTKESSWRKHLVLRPAPELDLNLNPWRPDFGLFEYILSGHNITSFTGPVSVDSPKDLIELLEAVATIRGSFEVCKVMCRFMRRFRRRPRTSDASDDAGEAEQRSRTSSSPRIDDRIDGSLSPPSIAPGLVSANSQGRAPEFDYDVDSWVKQQMENNPVGGVMLEQGPSGKRKRCGICGPCRVKVSCGECQQCRNRATSRQICKYRKCIYLKGKGRLSAHDNQLSDADGGVTVGVGRDTDTFAAAVKRLPESIDELDDGFRDTRYVRHSLLPAEIARVSNPPEQIKRLSLPSSSSKSLNMLQQQHPQPNRGAYSLLKGVQHRISLLSNGGGDRNGGSQSRALSLLSPTDITSAEPVVFDEEVQDPDFSSEASKPVQIFKSPNQLSPPASGEKPYSCGFCTESYAELDDLVTHLNETHLKNGLKKGREGGGTSEGIREGVSIKIKTTPSTSVRRPFTESASRFGDFRCVLCGHVARTEYLFNQHRLSHARPKLSLQTQQPQQLLFQCDFPGCDRQFGSDSLLRRHELIAHANEPRPSSSRDVSPDGDNLRSAIPNDPGSGGVDTFDAPTGNLDADFLSLNGDEASASGSSLYPCAECDARFVLIEDLEIHCSQVHENREERKSEDREEIEEDVEANGLNDGSDGDYLEDEGSVPPSSLPLACHLCAFRTSHSDKLLRHIRTHRTEMRPFTCPHCDKTFTQSHHLKSHMMVVHAPVKTAFRCHLCPRKYRRRSDLYVHMRNRHPFAKRENVPPVVVRLDEDDDNEDLDVSDDHLPPSALGEFPDPDPSPSTSFPLDDDDDCDDEEYDDALSPGISQSGAVTDGLSSGISNVVVKRLVNNGGVKRSASTAFGGGAAENSVIGVNRIAYDSNGGVGGSSTAPKRRRCGTCGPCQIKESCGECQQCKNRATARQICKLRKCIFLRGGNSKSRK